MASCEAIPTQDKLRVLANWLQVTPEWLRFGGDVLELANGREGDMDTPVGKLLASFIKLRERDRRIVMSLVEILEKN